MTQTCWLLICLVGLQLFALAKGGQATSKNGNKYSDSEWCAQYHIIQGPLVCDASGPIKINEQYHVFEDSCSWCHYISDDLIHWKQVNNTPFSSITGSIGYPNQGDNVFAFYGDYNQTAGILRATNNFVNDPTLQSWTLQGIVFENVDARPNFRDPSRPVYLNGKWYSAVASGVSSHGQFLWFECDNDDWTSFKQVGSLFNVSHTKGTINGATFVYDQNVNSSLSQLECPDVFPMKNKVVLMASLFASTQWWVGTIDTTNNVFEPQNVGLIDYGNFYAGKSGTTLLQSPEEPLRILFGFAGLADPTGCGRTHIIPRFMSLSQDNKMQFEPISQIETLHVESSYVNQIVYATSNNLPLSIKGSQLQIKLSCLELENTGKLFGSVTGNVSVSVLVSQDNTQYSEIGYNFDKQLFFVNHKHCCSIESTNVVQVAPFDVSNTDNENGINMNILVDASVIETFGNQQIVITSVIGPSNITAPNDRQVIFNGNEALSCQVEAWNLQL